MGIKSDKTFEEIVERIVALFKPDPEAVRVSAQPDPPQALEPDPTDPLPAASSDETEA